MRIDIVFPVLPPTLDGIGDHTARLSSALAEKGHEVGIFTAQETWDTIPNVSVRHGFSRERIRGVLDLVASVRASRPDWLIVQFEQFSYGRWGFNPYLPWVLYCLTRMLPGLQIAVFFHEDYTPPRSVKTTFMSMWQFPQFLLLCLLCDVAIFPVEPRANRYRQWFSQTEVMYMPVGSNIPGVGANRLSVRRKLGILEDAFVIGLFGSAHPARLLPFVKCALLQSKNVHPDTLLLYVGPHGEKVRNTIGNGIPLLDAGPLPGADVSRSFSAMDLYLAPFRYGVSARRGSFLAGIQHGIPTISTYGPDTCETLLRHNDKSFRLTPWEDMEAFVDGVLELAEDPSERDRLSIAGQLYYDTFHTWTVLAETLVEVLQNYEREDGAPAYNSPKIAMGI